MKKNSLRFVLSLAAAVCMLLAITVSASADFVGSYKAGEDIGVKTVFSTSNGITAAEREGDSWPEGIELNRTDSSIVISGKTNQTGTFVCRLAVTTGAGTEYVNVTLNISSNGSQSIDEYLTDPYGGTPQSTATPAPSASATPAPQAPPKITKDPTGEIVEVGGTAKFIARAENVKEFVWRIVSKDTTNTVPAKDASSYFSGLQVSGTDSDTLILSNIPASMNGWSVECRFINDYGSSFTKGAVITIENAADSTPKQEDNNVKSPVINTQPRGVNQELGAGCTLSVKASAPDGGTLSYQWYTAPDPESSNLTAIPDANSADFTPPQTEGTVYYCVGISNAKNGKESPAIYSQKAAVTYSRPTVPTATPAPSENPEATATPAPTATPKPSANRDGNFTTSLVFFGITGVLALVALVVIIIYLKKNMNTTPRE